ncbi:MAG: hypothetical protein ABI723_18865 [Bacteroidia bacterium]
MKKIPFAFLVFMISLNSFATAAEKGSTKHSFIHNVNISTAWFELGHFFPVKEKKLLSLPYGMDKYFYDTKGGFSAGFFSLGLYYKDKFGLEAIFRINDFHSENNDYRNYIAEQHPGYYTPQTLPAYYYSFQNIEYRICYKYHLKHFILEPKFQLGINDYSNSVMGFVLKEIGSNKFIEYKITNEDMRKNNFSYHFILNISKRFNPFKNSIKIEPALKFAYMIAPTEYKYTIEELPYGMPSTTNQFVVKHLNPAFGIEACVYFFFKK